MPVAPADHGAHEALVARHVDDRERQPVAEVEPRVAELDGDAALTLLGQAVRVRPRQRLDERGLAVVDVAGGAERQRRDQPASRARRGRRRRRARGLDVLVAQRAGVEQQPPVDHASDERRRALRAAPPAARRAGPAGRTRRSPGRAPAARRRRRGPRSRRPRRRAPRPAARRGRARRRAARGPCAARAARRARGRGSRCRRSVASSAASESLSMRSARASGWRRQRSTASPRADDDPGLRPAEQLVAAEAGQVAPGRRSSRARPARRPARGRGASTPEPRSSTTGTPRSRPRATSSRQRDVLGEADDAVVGRVRPQDQRGLGADRPLVVGRRGCGWWCRPRPGGRRSAARISGMRKPSPISTSWPRETTTSRPRANAASTSTSAAALLLTASAASAPVSSHEQRLDVALAAAAPAGAPGRARGSRSRRRSLATAATAAAASGARPEVRVHDDAGGVEHRAQRGRRLGGGGPRGELAGVGRPARPARTRVALRRQRLAHARAATARPARAASARAAGSRSTRSTLGRARRAASTGEDTRRRYSGISVAARATRWAAVRNRSCVARKASASPVAAASASATISRSSPRRLPTIDSWASL